MFNLAEYRRHADHLSDLLPWAALVAPGVVLNKDGSFQRSLRFRGPDLDSATDPQMVAAIGQLNNALRRLGGGWVLSVEARRRPAIDYPVDGHFPDPVSWLVDAERRDSFERLGHVFESEHHLTLQFLPPGESFQKARGRLLRDGGGEGDRYRKALEVFIAQTDRIGDLLAPVMHEAAFLDDAETLTYLHATVSTKRHRVAVPEVPMYLDALLADSPLLGGLKPMLGAHHLRTASVLGFPGSTTPAMLDALNHLPFEYRWVTRFIPLDRTAAERTLKEYRRRWFAKRKGLFTLLQEAVTRSESGLVDTAALRKAEDADEALQELAEDYVTYGYVTATVTVWDPDEAQANDKLRHVERTINGIGFTTIVETVNAVEAWLSSLPGHAYANVRKPLVSSLNLAHLIPFAAVWSGPARDAHLDAPVLIHTRTTGHTPFRIPFTVGDVGHKLVLGPTGAGKSVLLTFLALQFRRYRDAQVVIFDRGGSALAATAGVGGDHYDLGARDGGLCFQPLAGIDEAHERGWALEWIVGLLNGEGIEVTPQRKEAIWSALDGLAAMPRPQRTLTGLRMLVQDHEVRRGLIPYTLEGPLGYLLDADREPLADGSWQCFEMETLMEMKAAVPVVLGHLFHRLQQRFTGAPTLLIIDEAWLFLDHPMFAAKIRDWLKTLRKANVGVVLATQSIDDAIRSPITATLLEGCPVRIYLPNDRALEPQVADAYLQLGLNQRQIQLLAAATPKRHYYLQSRAGNRLFDLMLGNVALAFCAAGRPEDKRLVRDILAQYGKEDFVRHYLLAIGLDWALPIIDTGGDSDGLQP